MEKLKYKPTGYSYRVDDNVWAGEYPVWEWEQGARIRQLKLFTDFGINYFLDLTENGEMPPYASFLMNNIARHTFPIPNGCVPYSAKLVVDLFRTIDEVLNKPGTKLYIHCHGGVGRTGTIVACYYIYFKGMPADDALAEMRRRYATHGRSVWMSAPETEAQLNFIKEFANSYQQWK
ncbi:MAG: dual specificity protein phosphatase family protein [Bacteroidaceae bacterium]|nr:dual specificity protein phosphatase family protein [Bacteroidaceae bacterium]